ncbi:MAG: pyrimidine reductase [Zetaproteobacteria bacterium CG12_big_fil_rev_8_21_14_0_65_54_13]|nr:MAG: pyrimidine reductase [Zetaproteobacteria bacterium CG12_big_fil_rev_8_21_14_0_65_54_13]PIX54445.1 MAG: pyrimidine reductase [Zetaproteobacteria bacterium CG_4_10_14_3_um_filter_54_28]PJA28845.1 MAG: pyrimidine reductase [Zetaproteobacteria bacterium CG_4_9_14_3_um_filter_54_145]
MSVLQLFPADGQNMALHGLYRSLNLHRQAAAGDVLIYANYIASVDGRIAVPKRGSSESEVPAAIANPRDWRLYQELAAQSDVMLTSARYFRQLAKGCAQDLLPVGAGEAYSDLVQWRREQGLKPQPDVMVLSSSLDLPLASLHSLTDRNVMIVTGAESDVVKRASLEAEGFRVLVGGDDGQVDGRVLKQLLITHGYRSAYMIAGPEVHGTLLSAGVLDELFLTTHLSLLGGDGFYTIAGRQLDRTVKLQLRSLYLDQQDAGSQLFARYGMHGTAC